MLAIGLTGGIGSGKTTVSDLFAALGAPIIDADVIARELVSPGSPALSEIARTFGDQVLSANGTLDRDIMRKRVFSDPQAKQQLEAIVHPRVRDEIQAQLSRVEKPYAIASIPLLLEAEQIDLVDRVLVVDVSEQRQIDRVHKRDRLSQSEIRAIMSTQASREARLEIADDVLHNDGDLPELKSRVTDLHQSYLQMAHDLRSTGK